MLSRFFLPLNLYALANFAAAGLWTPGMTDQVLGTVPSVFVAVAIGTAFNRRVDTKVFSTALYNLIVGLGGVCLSSAFSA